MSVENRKEESLKSQNQRPAQALVPGPRLSRDCDPGDGPYGAAALKRMTPND
jgi:hypothetical protein